MGQTDTPTDGVGQAGEAAKEQARQVGQQAAEKSREAADAARGRAREQVDQRSTQAGEQLSSVAGDTRTVSEELRKQGKEQPAKLAEQAADRVDQVGDYLRRSDADTILRDVEDFGRRQPLAVVAGGFAIGLLASRFLKASSSERYHRSSSRGDEALSRSYSSSIRPAHEHAGRLVGSEDPTEAVGVGKGTRPTGLPAHS
jgi:ElaB/YqjD/DUF883 family membrane-anchored ribosome-binding protein